MLWKFNFPIDWFDTVVTLFRLSIRLRPSLLSHINRVYLIRRQDYLMAIQRDPIKSKFCKLRLLCRSLAGNNIYYLTVTAPSPPSQDDSTKVRQGKDTLTLAHSIHSFALFRYRRNVQLLWVLGYTRARPHHRGWWKAWWTLSPAIRWWPRNCVTNSYSNWFRCWIRTVWWWAIPEAHSPAKIWIVNIVRSYGKHIHRFGTPKRWSKDWPTNVVCWCIAICTHIHANITYSFMAVKTNVCPIRSCPNRCSRWCCTKMWPIRWVSCVHSIQISIFPWRGMLPTVLVHLHTILWTQNVYLRVSLFSISLLFILSAAASFPSKVVNSKFNAIKRVRAALLCGC